MASPFTVVQTLSGIGAAAAGALAVPSAYRLYNSTGAMAAQFQNEITYPSDLIQTNRDFYMSLRFTKYEKRTINNSPFLRSEGTIRLPLPDNLKDNSNMSYGAPALGAAVGAALESVVAAGNIIGATTSETISNAITAVGNTAYSAAAGAAAGALSQTGVGQAASAYLGLAVNPFQTVLFEKPEFKKHSFNWKFLPKSEKESDDVRNIIRTLQYHMHPGVDGDIGLFFSFPSRVIISLHPSSEFLYRFKPCVITSVNVNYAAGSAPSFFKRTKAPTALTISMSLTEIEYWTNNDFTANAYDDNAALGSFAAGEARRNAAQINQNAITLPNN